MSDTPRTDKAVGNWNYKHHEVVTSHFARTLERELNEAKFSAEHRKYLLDGAIYHREQAEKERDALRAKLDAETRRVECLERKYLQCPDCRDTSQQHRQSEGG